MRLTLDRACRTAKLRLQFVRMGYTITIRLSRDLADWLERTAASMGVSQGQLVRDQLEKAKANGPARSFMRLAGVVAGPKDLSQRKGYSLDIPSSRWIWRTSEFTAGTSAR